jgi:tRNA U34 5-methylaminomethyl-2-thiouridine-forming methyltransferase MnmC
MNAVEFVKKFGFDKAKDLACRDRTSIGYLSIEHHNLNQEDLKQIVDAWELVEKFGGLNESRKYVDNRILPELSRAINLVEQLND